MPSGPAGVRSSPVPWPGTASVGHPGQVGHVRRRRSGRGRTRRRGPGAPSRTAPRSARSGAQATISLRKVVADAGSVTPATRVVCSCRAICAIGAAWAEPRQRAGQGDDVLGPQHQRRDGGARRLERSAWPRSWAAKTRGRWHLLLVEAAPPAALDQGDRDGAHRRAPVGRQRAEEHDQGAARPGRRHPADGRAPRRSPQARQVATPDAAGPHAGREQQGPAHAGQLQAGDRRPGPGRRRRGGAHRRARSCGRPRPG